MPQPSSSDVPDFNNNYSGYNSYPDCDQTSPSEYYATTMTYGTTSYANKKGRAKVIFWIKKDKDSGNDYISPDFPATYWNVEQNLAALKTKCETQSISDSSGLYSELLFYYFSLSKREPITIEEVLYTEFCENDKTRTTSKTTTKKATPTKKDVESSAFKNHVFIIFISFFVILFYL